MADISFARYSSLILKQNLDLLKRELTITGDITDRVANKFDRQLKLLETQEGDITVIVNTYGGSIHASFAIIDRIRNSSCKINTIATGKIMSAGLGIVAAGFTRKATKYCIFMHHGLSAYGVSGTIPQVENDLKASKELDRMRFQFLAQQTKKPYSFWSSSGKHLDYTFNAESALDYGLIDEIL